MEITFKSISEYYNKEKDGLKPNTIREIDLEDDRFLYLISKFYEGFDENEIIIKIQNVITKESFKRYVEDISIWNDLMIISWNHKELEE